MRDAGLSLSPTFVAFTPWTTLDGYRDLLDTVERLGLVENVAPVQWAIRLLITHGSRLLHLADVAGLVAPFDPQSLIYPWSHEDPRVDALQKNVAEVVGVRAGRARVEVFREIHELVGASRRQHATPMRARATVPYLNEPWYC
jgi:hypothetical protein